MSTRLRNKWNPLIVGISHQYEVTKDFLKTWQSCLWKYIFKQDNNRSVMWSQPRNLENSPFTFYTVFLHTKHRTGPAGGLGKGAPQNKDDPSACDTRQGGSPNKDPSIWGQTQLSEPWWSSGQCHPLVPRLACPLLSTSDCLYRPWEKKQPIPHKFPSHLLFSL